ncbi:serine hydrolase domain-containing protein [Paucibacter sp. Y2R2-4]|uniref:serine hydrolase domain-containing protein n=1 Tax=Paucibacter sp. Y2R2-4 TaxID=2893553 RepID=UPI0021E4D841|nr:serine hydrolase domain-containing protein [Paucibacter sp. Y2R2-4]MCV2349442.1 beta-lactamase family protein [Paucibacter sp. Y2R2-4]
MPQHKPLALLLALAATATLSTAQAAPAIEASEASATAAAAAPLIAQIESAQASNRGKLDGLTLQEVMKKFGVPGLSIAVVKDFKIHWAKAYGVADVETGRAVDVNTAFQAASISKPVMAMAAVKLAQDGRLSLDADVNTMLRAWKVPQTELTRTQPVTPRALLSHTSGSDDGFGFPGYAPDAPLPSVVQIIQGDNKLANVSGVRFSRPPYQAAKYSGGGSLIMQQALTDLSGQPFAELMQSTVLAPLGMTGSSFQQPPRADWAPRLAYAHNHKGERMGAPWHVYPEQAAAGLWTTPSDLARYMIEVQQARRGPKGKVLTQHGALEMSSPVGSGPFAVGLQLEMRGQGWYFMHGGSNWGFQCDLTGHVLKG